MRTRTATCARGQLRANREGEPERVWLCNRTQRRKRTGSVHSVHAHFDRDRVEAEGAAKRFRRSSDAGRWADLAFCPGCDGSTAHRELEVLPGRTGVAAGAFADPDFPGPHGAVWVEHKRRWVLLPEGVPARLEQV